MHPLDGPRAKVRWAESRLETLHQSFQAVFEEHPYAVVIAERDPKTGNHCLRVRGGPDTFPDEWGVRIGAIAHDLRSGLDGLTWQLAISNNWTEAALNGRRPQLGFPIFARTTRRSTADCIREVESRLTPVRKSHLALITEFQPYKRGNRNQRSPLWLLHELNNADKHRLVTVVTASAGMLSATGLSGGTRLKTGVSLHPNAKVGHVRDLQEGVLVFDGIDPSTRKIKTRTIDKMQVDFKIAPQVRFGGSCHAVKRLPVIRTLQGMAHEVSRVLEAFSSEF